MSARSVRLRRIIGITAAVLVVVGVLGVAARVEKRDVGPPIASIDHSSISDATIPAPLNPLFPLTGLIGAVGISLGAARRRNRGPADVSLGVVAIGETRWRALLLGAPPLTTV